MPEIGKGKQETKELRDAIADIQDNIATLDNDIDAIDGATLTVVRDIVKRSLQIQKKTLRRQRILIRKMLAEKSDADPSFRAQRVIGKP